ncbi:protein-L-isoaspartate O-methyltransferase family protein [Candidatus Paracaedibacter symbiosus]|uniref:protein-L-isoaspartate O-methyltransferase family protein n=1 Tax=Candidatus Paracaedibacter symbiosus TaxID=244582 RepID=UPI0005096884|nr:hypothetical protein [Candidatus Paracaedibacter symbiosus]
MQAIIGKKNSDDVMRNFIHGQLRPNKVLNPDLLQAFESKDRADFLSPQYHSLAYIDSNLQAGNQRFFTSPLTLARLINLVEVKESDRCLIIGGLTGYSLAILSQLASTVFSLEQDQDFVQMIRDNFKEKPDYLSRIQQGTLTDGWPEKAPFNFILIEGGVETIPQKVFDQLSEGGSVVAVYNKNHLMGSGCIWRKNNGAITSTCVFDAYVPTLAGFASPKTFSL